MPQKGWIVLAAAPLHERIVGKVSIPDLPLPFWIIGGAVLALLVALGALLMRRIIKRRRKNRPLSARERELQEIIDQQAADLKARDSELLGMREERNAWINRMALRNLLMVIAHYIPRGDPDFQLFQEMVGGVGDYNVERDRLSILARFGHWVPPGCQEMALMHRALTAAVERRDSDSWRTVRTLDEQIDPGVAKAIEPPPAPSGGNPPAPAGWEEGETDARAMAPVAEKPASGAPPQRPPADHPRPAPMRSGAAARRVTAGSMAQLGRTALGPSAELQKDTTAYLGRVNQAAQTEPEAAQPALPAPPAPESSSSTFYALEEVSRVVVTYQSKPGDMRGAVLNFTSSRDIRRLIGDKIPADPQECLRVVQESDKKDGTLDLLGPILSVEVSRTTPS